jgi:hypothetical protein
MASSMTAAAEGFSRRRVSTASQNLAFVSLSDAPSIPILMRLLIKSIVVAFGVTARDRVGGTGTGSLWSSLSDSTLGWMSRFLEELGFWEVVTSLIIGSRGVCRLGDEDVEDEMLGDS